MTRTGEQTRSFCYFKDCLEGLYRLMRSDHHAGKGCSPLGDLRP